MARQDLGIRSQLDALVAYHKIKPPPMTTNKWLEDEHLEVYVRCTYRVIEGKKRTSLDLANITARPRNKGHFTRFLEDLEHNPPFEVIYIEQILTPRFRRFFQKRGYSEDMPHGQIPSAYKILRG